MFGSYYQRIKESGFCEFFGTVFAKYPKKELKNRKLEYQEGVFHTHIHFSYGKKNQGVIEYDQDTIHINQQEGFSGGKKNIVMPVADFIEIAEAIKKHHQERLKDMQNV